MTTESISGGAVQTPAENTQAAGDESPAVVVEQSAEQEAPATEQAGEQEQQQPEKVIPESYELTAPDGVTLPSDYLERARAMAKEYGLTQEQAQGLVERDTKLIGDFRATEIEAHNEQVQTWGDTVKADKELGGEKFDKTVALARDAVARFGDDDLKSLLNDSGYGNHPAVVRLFAKIGASIAEDNRPPGGNPTGQPRTAAEILYPSTNQE